MLTTKSVQVYNKQGLFALQNHEPGEIAYVEEDREYYIWDEQYGWQTLTIDDQGIDFKLYDLNKSAINQLDPLTQEEIDLNLALLNTFCQRTGNQYYMLLCKEYSYYTIFAQSSLIPIDFSKSVYSIIVELGDIYSIEETGDGAIEIWIKPEDQSLPLAFYLFPYDAGVVYYG